MPPPRLLIVDDDFHCRNIITTALSRYEFSVDQAENGQEALEALKKNEYNLVLCDLMMPKVDGMTVLQKFKESGNEGNFILITAFGTIEKAVEAMREGAFDFLVKPVNIKQLDHTVRKALENMQLRTQNERMREELRKKGLPAIIGKSRRLQEILSLVEKVAGNNSTVLITGPSGTGKELISKTIHYKSPRVGSPYVAVNCAAIPGTLLESQLFGYVKGAFTGAEQDRPGLFHQADTGTLFLDEVGELDLNLQVKLLRAIQESEVRRVGATQIEKIDLRLITATNRNLLEEVKKGNFREDLYYRLNVVQIEMPPLKERVEDLPDLVAHFIQKYNPVLGKAIRGTSEDFMRSLSSYDFPGNIRELENIIQKAMILADSAELSAALLTQKGGSFGADEQVSVATSGGGLHEMVMAMEKDAITRALRMFNANHSKVAKYLQIPRSTLYKKLHDYQIDVKKI